MIRSLTLAHRGWRLIAIVAAGAALLVTSCSRRPEGKFRHLGHAARRRHPGRRAGERRAARLDPLSRAGQRKYRLVRTDWSLEAQAYALQALLTGFIHTVTRTPVLHGVPFDTLDSIMAAVVTALLGPENAGPTDIRAAARQGLQMLHERRDAVLALITTNHATTEEMS
jgi:hypothetical protein